eukprot:719709-Rhodomonas_salina.1
MRVARARRVREDLRLKKQRFITEFDVAVSVKLDEIGRGTTPGRVPGTRVPGIFNLSAWSFRYFPTRPLVQTSSSTTRNSL